MLRVYQEAEAITIVTVLGEGKFSKLCNKISENSPNLPSSQTRKHLPRLAKVSKPTFNIMSGHQFLTIDTCSLLDSRSSFLGAIKV